MANRKVLNFNVGVLGHVDSGKTTLSKALSTVASTACFDKNPQSKERGITLDLGFSSFCTDAPSHFRSETGNESETYTNVQYTLVDCPGHASLIRAIIGGAQIIDLMLLVIDAIKGFQTQTSECLIIGEIACRKMIVVLNKVDLITDSKSVEKMQRRILKTLERTRFSGCPIIPVSANPSGTEGEISPIGMERLVETLKSETYIPSRDPNGPFVFSVDHCFSMRGQGTVMTGTVLSGKVALNDNVEIPALKVTKKVKSLQMFKRPVETATQGDRLGMCVTQFDPKSLERGLACQPGCLPTITAAIISFTKVPFYKAALQSKAKYHVTIGHDTIMAKATLFRRSAADTSPEPLSSVFDFSLDYEYLNELESNIDTADSESSTVKTCIYALLELERTITCSAMSFVIGSKLDTDIHSNACRIAFHGRLLEPIVAIDYVADVLPKLRVFKTKQREGTVERVHNDQTVIVKNMFKKETKLDAFVGLKVQLSSGEDGLIESTFGKSGKVCARFPAGLSESTKAHFPSVTKKVKSSGDGESQAGYEPIRVYLSFRRFIYDQSKKMMQ